MNAKYNAYHEARRYYFNGNYYQREIAAMTGVSERTIHNWIKEGSWEELRRDANVAPATIVDSFINQLIELQKNIDSREDGQRFPDSKEAEVQKKMLNNIINIKKYPDEIIKAYAASTAVISDIVPDAQQDTTVETGHVQEKPEISIQPEISNINTQQPTDNEASAHKNQDENAGKKSENTGNLISLPLASAQVNTAGFAPTYEAQNRSLAEDPGEEYYRAPGPITPELKNKIRTDLMHLFPNRRWEAIGFLMIRDIATNTKRKITIEEWNTLLAKGYTDQELQYALC